MDMKDKVWNPWHGCHKHSEGCQNCYVYVLDKRYGRQTDIVERNQSGFKAPIAKDRQGNYKMESGSYLRVCMTSDFFIEEADAWRDEAWDIIRQRPDLTFSLLTKRPERIMEHLPDDWGEGWENVQIAVSAENQRRADERIPILLSVPCKSRWVSVKPFIGEVDIEKYLATGGIHTVLAGGENYRGSRPLHYEWVKSLHDQCEHTDTPLIFAQTGNIFVKDGKEYRIFNRNMQTEQAIKSGLDYPDNSEFRLAQLQEVSEAKAKVKAEMKAKRNK